MPTTDDTTQDHFSVVGSDWSDTEVRLVVADYFKMLRLDLLNEKFNKAEHNHRLRAQIGRSRGSVEFKHQNISAVLVQMGLPYISGYKPRANIQGRLIPEVTAFLDANPGFIEQLAHAPRLDPPRLPNAAELPIDRMFEPPPDRITVPDLIPQPWRFRHQCRKTDFAKQDAENRRLGRLGEQFAVELEKRRLQTAGREDLAKKVEWVSDTCGDGAGFDVLSFDHHDDSEKYLEVKTTGLGKFFPFYVTANELRCSAAEPARYQLYRVFEFSRSPRVYVLNGSLSGNCKLEPMVYRAAL